jgi:hypothetical protein
MKDASPQPARDFPARWKILAVSGALVLVALAASVWVAWRRPPALPGLSFLGYTNKYRTFVAARLLVTNASRVPIEILPQIRNENVIEINGVFSHVSGFYSPFPERLPRLVQPGETTILDIHLNYGFREPWWTEVSTRPHFPPSRLRAYAAKIRQPTLRRWAQRVFPPVQDSFTKLGPFTNLPPGWTRMGDGSARRNSRKH